MERFNFSRWRGFPWSTRPSNSDFAGSIHPRDVKAFAYSARWCCAECALWPQWVDHGKPQQTSSFSCLFISSDLFSMKQKSFCPSLPLALWGNKFGDHARKEHEGHTLMSTVEAFQLAMQAGTDSVPQREEKTWKPSFVAFLLFHWVSSAISARIQFNSIQFNSIQFNSIQFNLI